MVAIIQVVAAILNRTQREQNVRPQLCRHVSQSFADQQSFEAQAVDMAFPLDLRVLMSGNL